MDLSGAQQQSNTPAETGQTRLSYKFQRLREKLRHAIETGELSGKLPGERQLAKQFRVNAKTLSKALTDLAAEGLLDRSIGRGTFVKGTAQSSASAIERWLIICDPAQASDEILGMLQHANPNTQVVTDVSSLRPSFLNQFKAAVNFSWATPDDFLRALVVRNMTVVLVNREPGMYSVNAVLTDRTLGASCLARDLMLAGHRSFLAVERHRQTAIADAIRGTATRYDIGATVDAADPADLPDGVDRGATAIICGTLPLAVEARDVLARNGISIPARVSLAGIGSGLGEYPCSGYWIPARSKADAILQLLRDPQARRPTTLWLHGTYVDVGTTEPLPPIPVEAADHLRPFSQVAV